MELTLKQKKKPLKTICIDIDGTICTNTNGNYNDAIPITKTINIINTLFEQRVYIILWTARGSKTKINWRNITEKQLKNWGVKYHKLLFGKPDYDLYIGDKCINIKDIT